MRTNRWHIVTDDYPPLDGGIATWAHHVGDGLAALGHDVTVWTRRRTNTPTVSGTVRVVGVRGRSFGRWGGWYIVFWSALSVRRGDRVLATTWTMAHPMGWWCRLVGAELHVVFHGSDLTRLSDPQSMVRVARRAHALWPVSQFLGERLRTLGLESVVLPAPVAVLKSALSRPYDRWLFVGRATPLKGADRFLAMVALEPTVKAVLVGDGECLDEWKRLAQTLGIAHRVTFTGRVAMSMMHAHYEWAGVLFLLSKTDDTGCGGEGFGLALVEAAMHSVAVVGCDTGGIREAVGAGLVLVDPDNASQSVREVRQWWTTERASECHDKVVAHHGVNRTVERLCR